MACFPYFVSSNEIKLFEFDCFWMLEYSQGENYYFSLSGTFSCHFILFPTIVRFFELFHLLNSLFSLILPMSVRQKKNIFFLVFLKFFNFLEYQRDTTITILILLPLIVEYFATYSVHFMLPNVAVHSKNTKLATTRKFSLISNPQTSWRYCGNVNFCWFYWVLAMKSILKWEMCTYRERWSAALSSLRWDCV